MKIICCQLNIAWEEKETNYAKVEAMVQAAGPVPDSLVVLPEMFATGFSMNVEGIHEGTASQTETFLSRLARENDIYVLGGLVTRGADGMGRNEAVVFSPQGKLLARYAKIHPFTMGEESKHYAGGSELVRFPWQEFTVTPFVCYDLRFPEIFRESVRRGTHIFVVIANWPAVRQHHWITLLQARAIENQAYVVGVNRCGKDPQRAYSGRSLVADPRGEILADAGNEEGFLNVGLNLETVTGWRKEFPVLNDMHEEYLPH